MKTGKARQTLACFPTTENIRRFHRHAASEVKRSGTAAATGIRQLLTERAASKKRCCYEPCRSWLACHLWRQLELDHFWQQRLPDGREAVSWERVLQLLVVNRLIDPGSELRVHRHWFLQSAMDELLGVDFATCPAATGVKCSPN